MVGLEHPADRLDEAIARCGAAACVGIDPVLERLPVALRPCDVSRVAAADALRRFGEGVIDAVAGVVPAVKVQSACFERHGAPGAAALEAVMARARARGLVTILDAKRGDIGISAEHYAAAAFDGPAPADWVTVSPWLGADGIAPFLARGGVFVLVRTSNPGGDALQSLELAGGGSVAEAVARLVAELGAGCRGRRGLSALGAVVGATRPEAARSLRGLMPDQVLLVPGFGAQGGGVDDVRPCFRPDGRGALVTASRSVIYAFDDDDPDWTAAVRRAAESLVAELAGIARRNAAP